MKINLQIIEQLKTLSLSSTYTKHPIAAAIVYRNKIISFGINQSKTHPYQMRYGRNKESIYWHAETNALYIADKKLGFDKFHNASLYIARMKWNGTDKKTLVHGLSLPCDGCMRCIKEYGIKSIIYTLDQVEGEKENFGIMLL